jgi:hypothetical protein
LPQFSAELINIIVKYFVILYEDGSEYNGDVNAQGVPDGNGVQIWKDGCWIEGQWKNGIILAVRGKWKVRTGEREGPIWARQRKYEIKEAVCVLDKYDPNQTKYTIWEVLEGDININKPGQKYKLKSRIEFEMGTLVRECEMRGCECGGEGTETHFNERNEVVSVYKGSMRGVYGPHGYGIRKYTTHGLYVQDEGEYEDGKLIDGTRKYKDKSVYKGRFQRDMKHGFGQLQFENGDWLQGHWEEDRIKHGKGKLGDEKLIWEGGVRATSFESGEWSIDK